MGVYHNVPAKTLTIFMNSKPSIDIQISALNNITTARLPKSVKPLPISMYTSQIDATTPSKPRTKLDHIQFSITKATSTAPILSTT